MRFWERIRIALKLLAGMRYGIIIDSDYASGGIVSNFSIKGADIGIYVAGHPWKDEEGRAKICIADNKLSGR